MNCHEKSGRGSPSKRPIEVLDGNTRLKIYCGRCVKDGKTYKLFTVCYYEDGKRQRKAFGSLDDAKTEAGKIANRLDNGEREAARMTKVQ